MKRNDSRLFLFGVLGFCLLVLGLAPELKAKIPKPEDFLGFKVGTARRLADMHQIIEYFKLLDKASERIVVQEAGKTTLGNPFIYALITSEKNQRELDRYQEWQQKLADPRRISDKDAKEIISRGKAVVMINCSIHASEIGAAQMSMELAYNLVSRDDPVTRAILNNVILLLIPMHNPDGIQMVVEWYRKYVGTKYEGCRMPWLYHKYVGHDNNRDWYMFTQVESRLTVEKIHNVWHPQIVVDMHQMGRNGARLFVPPYVDPYEPNVDPIIRQEVAMMGTFIATELTAQGKAGVIHSHRFDAWAPARAYHHYHGAIRILTEAASVKVATPVNIPFDQLAPEVKKPSVKMPLPWKGGRWTLRDIVEYDLAAAWAVLTNAARLRKHWLRNFYEIHKKAVRRQEAPFAFIIPASQKDKAAMARMLQTLQIGLVEIHQAEESFSADGYSYPAGSYIVFLAQPYGGYAKALLERQEYPEIREYPGGPLKTPYDVVAHTLPLLMGVEVIQVEKPFSVKAKLINQISLPPGKFLKTPEARFYFWSHSGDGFIALNKLVGKYDCFWLAQPVRDKEGTWPAGTMLVRSTPRLEDDLRRLAAELPVEFKPFTGNLPADVYALRPVRLGIYKSWTASMDEGWLRWVMEQFKFPYYSLMDKDIRRGQLREKVDVLIIPDMNEKNIIEGLAEGTVPPEYTGGIGEIGLRNIRDFVRAGGTLITVNSACRLALNKFFLQVKDVTQGLDRKEFFIPGSILTVLARENHPLTYGFGREVAIMFRRSPVFQLEEGQSLLNYPLNNPLLSGWVNGAKILFGRSALAEIPYGQGKVILIGFPVYYRGQAHGTFRFLFNAIYYGVADRQQLK
jgi:hypothetical protein